MLAPFSRCRLQEQVAGRRVALEVQRVLSDIHYSRDSWKYFQECASPAALPGTTDRGLDEMGCLVCVAAVRGVLG